MEQTGRQRTEENTGNWFDICPSLTERLPLWTRKRVPTR